MSDQESAELDIRTTQLNEAQQAVLLRLARQAILSHLTTGRLIDSPPEDQLLARRAGVFVTLRRIGKLADPPAEPGQLRGCIGHMQADRPLHDVVATMAVQAATCDPRFNSLSAEELSDITIEISVLSPLTRVSALEEIEIGTHGVVVFGDDKKALLLPEVASRYGWSREELLRNLCYKAWLPVDFWQRPEAILLRFTTQSFEDRGPS
jgi:hypothetical protein